MSIDLSRDRTFGPVRQLTVLEHVPFKGPGAIADWAEARGHGLRRIPLHLGADAPSVAAIDVLAVVGGPMGVGDEQRFPFLREEKRLLRQCVDEGRPVLGVCLGAQLLASVLGARVSAQGYREIGWFPVIWDAPVRTVPPFSHVPDLSVVFHWHGDTFEFPTGTVPVAASAACANQGFASPDGRLIGLQFHLEMDASDVQNLVAHGRGDLEPRGPFVQTEAEILAGHVRHGAPLNSLLATVLDTWIATAV